MKKFKKGDLQKLALLGIAGGTALATEAQAAEVANLNPSELLAFAQCGGSSGCHGGSYQAYRSPNNYYYNQAPQSGCSSMPQTQGYYYQQPQSQYYQQPQSQGYYYQQPQSQYYQQPQSQGYYQQPSSSSGCASMSDPNYYNQGRQPSSGCASMTQPQYQSMREMPSMPSMSSQSTASSGCGAMSPQMTKQMMAGCNAPRPSQGQMPDQPETAAPVDTPEDNVKKGQAYTQWETAENYRPQTSQMQNSKNNSYQSMPDTQKSAPKQKMTESDLMSQLNAQGKATYQGLDSAGKALALKLANQDCKGQNECKGLNSCKTSDHACAGKGSCAGTATAPFKDKNLAVKVAAMKMAEKRANASYSN